jgi:hypothetical protein
MIERYLMLGARFKWTHPRPDASNPKDGRLVPNPQPSIAPMIYDGMDSHGFVGFRNPRDAGLAMGMTIPFDWLAFGQGVTAYRPLGANDILTGPMSGCLIVEYTAQGQRFIGHVGTETGMEENNKRVKATFLQNMPSQARGFNPAASWGPHNIPAIYSRFNKPQMFHVFALVTRSVEFYSVLMIEMVQSKEYAVGGIVKVPPMNAQQLRTALGGQNWAAGASAVPGPVPPPRGPMIGQRPAAAPPGWTPGRIPGR